MDIDGVEWVCTVEDLGSVNSTAIYRMDDWDPVAIAESTTFMLETGPSIDLLADNSPLPKKNSTDRAQELKRKLDHAETPRFHVLPKPPKECSPSAFGQFEGFTRTESAAALNLGDVLRFGGVFCRFIRSSFGVGVGNNIASSGGSSVNQSPISKSPRQTKKSTVAWISVKRPNRVSVPASHWTTSISPTKSASPGKGLSPGKLSPGKSLSSDDGSSPGKDAAGDNESDESPKQRVSQRAVQQGIAGGQEAMTTLTAMIGKKRVRDQADSEPDECSVDVTSSACLRKELAKKRLHMRSLEVEIIGLEDALRSMGETVENETAVVKARAGKVNGDSNGLGCEQYRM